MFPRVQQSIHPLSLVGHFLDHLYPRRSPSPPATGIMPVWIVIAQRVIQGVGIEVQALRFGKVLAGASSGLMKRLMLDP